MINFMLCFIVCLVCLEEAKHLGYVSLRCTLQLTSTLIS